jgi:deazaflavin-dependent oxidoreductase (nitroreductase family)
MSESSQKVEQTWETPPADEIISLTAQHVQAMETMDVDEVWQQAGMHHVLLRTIGRKSGKEHKVALPTWRDSKGRRIVVASFAGAEKNPAWFVNLADRDANPEVLVKVQDALYWSVPEILDGAEYEKTWAALCADRAWYNDYQAKCDRRIPLVALPVTRPA